MKELEPDASQRLERYLSQIRAALRGARSVDSGEVEADVEAHISSIRRSFWLTEHFSWRWSSCRSSS